MRRGFSCAVDSDRARRFPFFSVAWSGSERVPGSQIKCGTR